MEKRMNKDELVNLIESLKISKDEYWILSSSALVLRGIYKDAGDLDIAVTEKGLQVLVLCRFTGFVWRCCTGKCCGSYKGNGREVKCIRTSSIWGWVASYIAYKWADP